MEQHRHYHDSKIGAFYKYLSQTNEIIRLLTRNSLSKKYLKEC